MSDNDGFIKDVVSVLSRALRPLSDAVSTPAEFNALLLRLGWQAPALDATPAAFGTAASAINNLSADLNNNAGTVALLADIVEVMDALGALRNTATGGSLGAPFDNPEFWTTLPEDLLGLLLSTTLELEAPGVYAILTFAGALRKRAVEANADTGRAAYVAREMDWSALGRLVGSPADIMRDVYGWGNTFDHVAFLDALHAIATGLGGSAALLNVSIEQLRPLVGPDNPERSRMRQLLMATPAVSSPSLDVFVKSALSVTALPPTGAPSAHPEGVLVSPVITGAAQTDMALPGGATLHLSGDFQGSPARLGVRPAGVTLESAQTSIDLAAELTIAPPTALLLGGTADGTRFELRTGHVGVAVQGSNSNYDLAIDLGLDDALVVIDFSAADAFIRDRLGSGQQTLPISLNVTWSYADGLRFSGAAIPTIRLPVNLVLADVLTLEEIEISLSTLEPDGAALGVAATGALELGPFVVVFERMGVQVEVIPSSFEAPGNFGLVDLGLGFKPPTGLGLSLDVGAVRGGGFISHEADIGRYAGAAELTVLNTGIAAVGVLLSRIPETPDSWSMFMSLAARFVGVQLGFGFTLNGVGGLVGINRGLDDDALGDAVRTGSLDAILFPEDPVADATRILADIDAIFPPAAGQYVFGPVIKIGWGTPSLVELDVGVAIQLPEPLTISLLGALVAVLPDREAPILELHAAFAGTVNFTEGTLKIDASLTGSQVAGLLITGDLSVRMEFFGQPSFLVAFGGFHPGFDPPSSFPRLERLGITLDTGDILQISLGGYFALSSNSIQFGSFAHLYISEAGFTAEGGVSFDALIIYRPFSFSIGLSVWISISAGRAELLCVLLEGNLNGPNPWLVAAEASFKILGLKQSIDVQATFGDTERQSAIEQADVQSLLEAELERDDAWSILSPVGDVPVIAAETSEPAETQLIDPAGRVQISQRIVPLDREIERYGNAELEDANQFSITVQGFAATEIEDIEEWFGSEHYFRLQQDERLSAPSFTLMKAGMVVGSDRAEAPAARSMTYDHERAYKDKYAEPRRTIGLAGAASLDRALATRTDAGRTQQFEARTPTYVVCDADTGAESDLSFSNDDFFGARAALVSSTLDYAVVTPTYELELRS